MRIITLGIIILLIGLVGWFTVPGFVLMSLNVPVVQGQVSASQVPAWFAALAIAFPLLLIVGAVMSVVGLAQRVRRKSRRLE